MEEVVITGTRIRGVQKLPTPAITFTREEIEKTGYTTVEELFESLPQNFAEIGWNAGFAFEGTSDLAVQNSQQRASGIDLRGLGAQSTLTLINGARMTGSVNGQVVDISALPLSVIERTEIVTGGRSAIYGSDAVGGVVNLVTRRDFDGAETLLSFGAADHGGERLELSQVVGADFGRGGFVATYDYQREWSLDVVKRDLTVPTAGFGFDPIRLEAQPDAWRHALFLAGRFALNDRAELYTDAFYTHKKHEVLTRYIYRLFGATEESVEDQDNRDYLYRLAAGARMQLGGTWTLDVSGARSVMDERFHNFNVIDTGSGPAESEFLSENRSTMETAVAVADGPLLPIGGITPRAAFGVEARNENVENDFDATDREVRSVFGEVFIPLIDASEGPGTRSLGLSLAGRYDDYDDVGGTFNPQAGIVWEPTRGVTLRSAYSTAFRAPPLVQLGETVRTTTLFVFEVGDPASPNDLSPVLFWQGSDPDLGPEEAVTWSAGIDFEPAFAPGTRLSLSYFDIDYDDRISMPADDPFLVLEREARYVDFLNRTPSPAEIAAIVAEDDDGIVLNFTSTPYNPGDDLLQAFPNLVVFDTRVTNVAVEKVRGLDLMLDTERDTGRGTLSFGVNVSYTLDHESRATATSPVADKLNEVGKPVDLRVRADAGWERGAYGGFLYLNYVDSYADPFATPTGSIDSWTTLDLTLRFDGSRLSTNGFLQGLNATLRINNLLDEDPPQFLHSSFGYRYDPVNANGIGRYVTLHLRKRW